MHQLDAYLVALELIRSLRPVLDLIDRKDKDLAKQGRRAASSTALNIKEGGRRQGRDRRYHFTVAAGSADELRGCLEVAEAWGYLEASAIATALALLDRELAMLHGLTR
jgi:four helix bundle protein